VNSQTSPFSAQWEWRCPVNNLVLRDIDNSTNKMTVTSNGTEAEFGFNGTSSAGYTFTITSVTAANRPAIRIVNANATLGGAITAKAFAGWIPIRIEATDYYLPIYS
jgi:hypothetical protein